jgi:hypothetical protein
MSTQEQTEPIMLHPGEEAAQVTSIDRIGVIAQHTARVYQTLLHMTGDPQVSVSLTDITLRTIGPLAFNQSVNFVN